MELKNAVVVQAAGTAVNAALSFALLIIIGRALGTDSFGLYVALLGTATLALIVIEGGWPTLLYRDGARPGTGIRETDALAAHAVAWISAAAPLLAATGAVAGWLLWPAHLRVGPGDVAAALLCMGCVAGMNLVSARLRGAGRFAHEAGWQVAGRVLSAALIVLVLPYADSAFAPVFAAWGLGLAVLLVAHGRRWLALPSWRGWHASARFAVPFVMFEGLLALLLRSDVAVLGAAGVASAPLSHYAACTRWTEAALLLFAPVSNVLLRGILHAGNARAGRLLVSRFAWLAFAAGCVCVVLAALFGDRLMPFVFGEEFAAAGVLLPWVAAMLPFALANLIRFQWALATGAERLLVRRVAAGVGLLVAGLLIGNVFDGVRGAAIGVMLAHAAVLVLGLVTTRLPTPVEAA